MLRQRILYFKRYFILQKKGEFYEKKPENVTEDDFIMLPTWILFKELIAKMKNIRKRNRSGFC